MNFENFVDLHGARLRAALVAGYGVDVGADATAEALAYGFENWERVSAMQNPAGYLYRVGQTEARRSLERTSREIGRLPEQATRGLPAFEPALVPALKALTDIQRTCVVMVHALGWGLTETANVLDIDISTVRTHIARAMSSLRSALEVNHAV